MLRAVLIAVLAALHVSAAFAQSYPWKPTRPITLIVPFGAGGAVDIIARTIAETLGKSLNGIIVVEDKPGAAGVYGIRTALSRPHDGYTWLMHREDAFASGIATGNVRTQLSDWRAYHIASTDKYRYALYLHDRAPQTVRRTLDLVWDRVIAPSAELKSRVATFQMQFTPSYGDADKTQTAAAAPAQGANADAPLCRNTSASGYGPCNPTIAADLATCRDNTAAQASSLSACTRVISDGQLQSADLAVVRYFRGQRYIVLHDYSVALADLDEAIRLNPAYADAFNMRGVVYARLSQYDRALSDADSAIRLKANNAVFHANRGFVRVKTGSFAAAVTDYSEAIRILPTHPVPYAGRGAAYKGLNDFDRALADLNESIRLDPKIARAYFHRGDIYLRQGDLQRAQTELQRSLELDGNDAEARTLLAKVQADLVRSPAGAAAPAPPPVAAPPAVSSIPAIAGPRVALVIGNASYKHATPLANPTNDAADFASALRRLGFDVVEGLDLDKHAMETRVREFGRKLDRAGLALFYYAGHGLQVAGRNYLVPVDAKLERAGDLSFETLDVSQVLAQMEAERRVNLVFLDACRDNPLSRSLARSLGVRSAAVGSGLAGIQSAVGTLIAFATQPEHVALDGSGRNSPFTEALLRHIGTRGLEIGSLMRRVRADVVQATNGKQVPWDHSSLLGDVVLAQ